MAHFYNFGITSSTQKITLQLNQILAWHLFINLESQIEQMYGTLLFALAYKAYPSSKLLTWTPIMDSYFKT